MWREGDLSRSYHGSGLPSEKHKQVTRSTEKCKRLNRKARTNTQTLSALPGLTYVHLQSLFVSRKTQCCFSTTRHVFWWKWVYAWLKHTCTRTGLWGLVLRRKCWFLIRQFRKRSEFFCSLFNQCGTTEIYKGDGDTLTSHRSMTQYKDTRKSFTMVLYGGHVYLGVWVAKAGGSLTGRLCSRRCNPPQGIPWQGGFKEISVYVPRWLILTSGARWREHEPDRPQVALLNLAITVSKSTSSLRVNTDQWPSSSNQEKRRNYQGELKRIGMDWARGI